MKHYVVSSNCCTIIFKRIVQSTLFVSLSSLQKTWLLSPRIPNALYFSSSIFDLILYDITKQKITMYYNNILKLFRQIKNYSQLLHFPKICNTWKENTPKIVYIRYIVLTMMHRWTLLWKCCKTPALLLTDLPVCTSSVSRHWAHELCVGMRFFHALYEREFPPWLLQWARASFRWPSPGKRHWPENTIIHRHIFLPLRRNSNDCMQLKRWGP